MEKHRVQMRRDLPPPAALWRENTLQGASAGARSPLGKLTPQSR